MENITIQGNGKKIPLLYFQEIKKKDQAYYHGMFDGIEDSLFFYYKKYCYLFDDFLRTDSIGPFSPYDGYLSDSFFSGILIKLIDDDDNFIKAYTYYD